MGMELFLLSVGAYAFLPLLYVLRQTSFQFVLLYAHIAAVLTVGGFFGAVYAMTVNAPLIGPVVVMAGQDAYAAFMFTTLLTTIVGRDLQVVRNVIALTLCVNALKILLILLGDRALNDPDATSPVGVPPEFFNQSMPVVIGGGLLIILELVLLVAALEWAKGRFSSLAMIIVYPVTFLGILLLDGALFPLLVLRPETGMLAAIENGVAVKAVLGLAFAVPLLIFVVGYRRVVERYEEDPLRLEQLLLLNREELLQGRATATFERILDSATNTLLVVLDPDLRITHFNAGAERVLGYTADEMRGHTTARLISREEAARHARAMGVPNQLASLIRGQVRAAVPHEWEVVNAFGYQCVISLSVSEITARGRLTGYLIAGEDVTSKARAERAMMLALQREHEAKQRLHEADTVKHELVSTVSHELRTPITSITGYAELLGEGLFGELNEKQVEALGKVLRNTQRLESMVEDLLVLERVESGRMRFDKEPMDLRTAVSEIEDMLLELVRGRGLRLQFHLSPEPVPVTGDRSALERVVINLVSNAAKFTPQGDITVEVRSGDGQAVLLVSDTGIGISAEDQERLFTRFFRTEQANARAIPGTGLGLSIVQAIVEGHGGRITVLSNPGRGTTMATTIPLATESGAGTSTG